MITLTQLPALHKDLFIEGIWSSAYIHKLIDEPSEPEDYPNALLDLHNCLSDIDLSNKNILVVGSITPWIECYLLKLGANHVYTTDVNEIQIQDPRISFIYTSQLPKNYYDIIVSFSSVEHIGLGRYGDPLDENGDINFMDESFDLLKENGAFVLGIPVAERYILADIWHRIYDNSRLNTLIKKYTLLKSSKNGNVLPYVDFTFDSYYAYDWQNQPVMFLAKNKL